MAKTRRDGWKLTPEQRANISRGRRRVLAAMSPEAHAAWCQALRDTYRCSVRVPRGRPNFTKGNTVQPDAVAIEKRWQTRHLNASIKSIMRDLVAEDPEAIRRALREGLNAPPPRSYPYLALAAAYLDGRPTEKVELTVSDQPPQWIAYLTDEQLAQIAVWIEEAEARAAGIIDITPQSRALTSEEAR